MKNFAIATAFLAAAGVARAEHYQEYLPLKKGNEWTFYRSHPQMKFAPWTTSADRKYDTMFHLTGLPGFEDGVWVAWSGNTLYAWSWTYDKWVAFLRFGAATGTTYTVSVDDSMWNNTKVTVQSKTKKLYNPHLNLTHTYVVHFTFEHPMLMDAGVVEYMFDATYGLVHFSTQSFGGPVTGWLGAGKVNGRKFGPFTYEFLEGGQVTNYPGSNQIVLVNNPAQWQNLYAQHKPGAAVPSVDFSKKTVLAIFAGQRNTGGYGVQLSGAWYNYPVTASARLKILETTPAGPVIQMITSPYAFYILDTKVTSAQYDWEVLWNK